MSNKKKEFFLVRWFKRCFLHERPELSTEEEEKIQTPMRAMVNNFTHRPLAMFGLIVFLAIFVFVMVGPHIWVLDLSEQDSTLTNLPPSNNMMQVPKALLDNGVKDISSGNTYGVGIDSKGELYTWGHTRITDKIDVANIPDEIKSADLVQIAAGTDHVVAVDTDGEVYVWGNTRLQQDKFSNDMKKAMKAGGADWDVVQLEAGNQFSAIVCSDGNLYLWGNGNMADIKIRSKYQGKVAKVALTDNEYIALLTDGTVAYTGNKDKTSPFAKVPAGLKGKKVVDIASTARSTSGATPCGARPMCRRLNPRSFTSTAAAITTPRCWKTANWFPGATTNTARLTCLPRRRARTTSKKSSFPATRTTRWPATARCTRGGSRALCSARTASAATC